TAIEAGPLLDGKRLAVNVAFDDGAGVKSNPRTQDGALNLPIDLDNLSRNGAVDDGFLADGQLHAVQIGLDIAVDTQRALAANGNGLAFDGEVVADHRLVGILSGRARIAIGPHRSRCWGRRTGCRVHGLDLQRVDVGGPRFGFTCEHHTSRLPSDDNSAAKHPSAKWSNCVLRPLTMQKICTRMSC